MARIELQFIDKSKTKGTWNDPSPNAPGVFTLSDEWGIGLTQGQKPRTPEQAIESFTSWVYICASLNASAVASVPLRLYATKTSKSQKFKSISTKPIDKKQLKWLSSNAGIESYLKKAVEVEEVTEHPFLELMATPNKFITSFLVKETTSLFTDLTGDAYWYLTRGKLGIPEQIWVIPSQYITPIYGETLDDFVKGYKFQRGRTELILPLEDVIHFSYPNPKNQYQGFGCVAGVCDAVYVNAKMFEYEEAVFKNKARTGGVLESTEGISRPEMERLRLEWQQKYEGAAAGGRTVILPPGMKFTKDTMNPSELSFIEGKKATAEEIMAAFDVPPGSIRTEGVNRCYDEQTEYLTDNGWKQYDDVNKDDKLGTLCKGSLVFEPWINRWKYDYDGTMYHYNSGTTDLMVTPNHGLLYKTPRKGYRVDRAENTKLKKIHFKTACNWKGKNSIKIPFDISLETWLEFLGYFISEGGLSVTAERTKGYVFTLAQKNPYHAEKIRTCLDKLPFNHSEYGKDLYRWNVFGKAIWAYLRENIGRYCADKKIPKEIKALNKRYLSILFNALMLGDGSWDIRPKRTSGYYATTSKRLADDFMEISLKLGFRTSCQKRKGKKENHNDVYYIHISRRAHVCVNEYAMTTVDYRGKVACFEVPHHLLFTRRNGFVSIQGNSNAEVADYRHAKNGILPRCTRQEQVINQFVIPLYGNKEGQIFVAYDDPVPANREAELKENTEYVSSGVLAIDEIRGDLGKEPLPDDIGALPYQDGRRVQVGAVAQQPGRLVEPSPEKLAEELEKRTMEALRKRLK